MTIDEFFKVHQGPFEARPSLEDCSSEIRDANGETILFAPYDPHFVFQHAAILNDAWSRHPREGERRCGTCRHWQAHWDADHPMLCNAPFPASTAAADRRFMYDNGGCDCPLWQRKETKP